MVKHLPMHPQTVPAAFGLLGNGERGKGMVKHLSMHPQTVPAAFGAAGKWGEGKRHGKAPPYAPTDCSCHLWGCWEMGRGEKAW